MASQEWSERIIPVAGVELPVVTGDCGPASSRSGSTDRFRPRSGSDVSELTNSDVIPALREHGKKLGLVSPFEREPGSRSLAREANYEPVADPSSLMDYASAFGDPE
jgi:hypothetical protein